MTLLAVFALALAQADSMERTFTELLQVWRDGDLAERDKAGVALARRWAEWGHARVATLCTLTGDGDPDVAARARALLAVIAERDTSGDSVRSRAIEQHAIHGHTHAIPEIAPFLADRSQSVVAATMFALGRLGARQYVDSIVPFLNHDRLWKPALDALVELDERSTVPAITLLLNYGNNERRAEALDALVTYFRAPGLVPHIIAGIQRETGGTRWRLMYGSADLCRADAVAIASAFENGPDTQLRDWSTRTRRELAQTHVDRMHRMRPRTGASVR